MENNIYNSMYNPDVLSCLANLSNDEVFTPPEIANKMLDMLPQELFCSPGTKFLDPACKSGVFLREIAKRLLKGLERQIPDLQQRIDHIFGQQLYGIAITELTSLLSRRGVYCSKYPNSPYSVTQFDDASGNIRYKKIQHRWQSGKCVFCGASQSQYDRDKTLETHAYELIHTTRPEEIFKMKFDVIIGNPPYQLSDGGNNASAGPIYNRFVEQAMKMKPRFLSMIIPSRYFSGGKGLDTFRKKMLNDTHLSKITDYINAKDCFPENSISGGVNYFLWERDFCGTCEFTTIFGNRTNTMRRKLNEFPSFVRYNQAISIIHKTEDISKQSLSEIVSSRNPYGLATSVRGTEQRVSGNDLIVYSSKGPGYISYRDITNGQASLSKHRVMLSRITYEHAGEPDKEGMLRVLSRIQVLKPLEVCTDSYIIVGECNSDAEANNIAGYLKTKFARFLIFQTLSAINLSKDKFCFVPMQDFSKLWTDAELYAKYNLTSEEIAFIESMIRPMDLGGDSSGE